MKKPAGLGPSYAAQFRDDAPENPAFREQVAIVLEDWNEACTSQPGNDPDSVAPASYTIGYSQPATWDLKSGKNIKWVAELGSQAYAGPILKDGRVFVGNGTNPAGEFEGWHVELP